MYGIRFHIGENEKAISDVKKCLHVHALSRTHVYLDITVIMDAIANVLGFPRKKKFRKLTF